MKVIPTFSFDGNSIELYMEPQNDLDNQRLEYIEQNCVTVGCGRTQRDDGSWRMLHVRIALELKE